MDHNKRSSNVEISGGETVVTGDLTGRDKIVHYHYPRGLVLAALALVLITLAVFIQRKPPDPQKDEIDKLFSTLISSDENDWEKTCTALQQKAIQFAAKKKIQAKLTEYIGRKTGPGFGGLALCVSQEGFFALQEAQAPLKAIETRLGADGSLCEQADRLSVKYAVRAEYTFPSATKNAPDFLIGVIRNCPAKDAEFESVRDTALHHLELVFRDKYKNNQEDCNRDLADRLGTLRQAVSDTVRQEIDNYFAGRITSPCQDGSDS